LKLIPFRTQAGYTRAARCVALQQFTAFGFQRSSQTKALQRAIDTHSTYYVRRSSAVALRVAPQCAPASRPRRKRVFGMTLPNGLGGSSQLHCSHNNKDAHDPVDVGHQLGEKGEPALCVVCSTWDERLHGQKRRSGHECQRCIGQKSLDRIRKELQRFLEIRIPECRNRCIAV
jgi:hypothetical protein